MRLGTHLRHMLGLFEHYNHPDTALVPSSLRPLRMLLVVQSYCVFRDHVLRVYAVHCDRYEQQNKSGRDLQSEAWIWRNNWSKRLRWRARPKRWGRPEFNPTF
jgi:hypothetical protein